MDTDIIYDLIKDIDNYNLHSHTQYCDGRAPVDVMARAACEAGMSVWGVSPHSPVCVDSPCNMNIGDVDSYVADVARVAQEHDGIMTVLTGMEIDFISRDFGPHIDVFQSMPLDYRIGSVHFVPDRDGHPVDCDGSATRFRSYLHDVFRDDVRYVVEKYFEQVLVMLELGGFDLLGHFDKIIGNVSEVAPEIEHAGWYESLIDDVVSHAASSGVIVEINTKAIIDRKRFFPAEKWWKKLIDGRLRIAVDSDAHYPDKVNLGRQEALSRLDSLRNTSPGSKAATSTPSKF